MRIRKRFTTPSSPPVPPPPLAPLTPPHSLLLVESFHHHEQHQQQEEEAPPPPPCNPPSSIEDQIHLQPPAARSDLQLILVKGTHGWVCKTDDGSDCMHPIPTPSTLLKDSQETFSSLDADSIHLSFGAKEGLGNIVSTSFSQQDGDNKTITVEDGSETIKKKRKKADKDSVMTEGARCSRVNGRGWRCCQPTLVGYSLCEHHTSKGRIRTGNMTPSTDNIQDEKVESSLSSTPPSLSPLSSSISVNEKPLTKTIMKRKKKGGVGKARSISSILGQTEPQLCAPPLPLQIVDSVIGLP